MATYETKISVALRQRASVRELRWLHRELAKRGAGVIAENTGEGDLWFHGDSVNVDEFVSVLAGFQDKFARRRYTPVIVRAAFDCSRPVLDAYGGAVWAVYAGRVFRPRVDPEECVKNQVMELGGSRHKRINWRGQL